MDWSKYRVTNLPAPDKFWKIAFPDAGDKKADTLFAAVGSALTSWETLEDNFSHLFGLFVGEDSHAARRAYGTIDLNAQRRTAAKSAAEIFFRERGVSQIDQNEFAKIVEHFGRASGRRNEIAHGQVWGFGKDRQCLLVPPGYNSKQNRAFANPATFKADSLLMPNKAEYRYASGEILDFSKRFKRLADATISYYFYVRETYRKKEQD